MKKNIRCTKEEFTKAFYKYVKKPDISSYMDSDFFGKIKKNKFNILYHKAHIVMPTDILKGIIIERKDEVIEINYSVTRDMNSKLSIVVGAFLFMMGVIISPNLIMNGQYEILLFDLLSAAFTILALYGKRDGERLLKQFQKVLDECNKIKK